MPDRVIPTLCVGREKVFESVIPTLAELYEAILPRAKSASQRLRVEEAFLRAQRDYR